MKIKFGLMLGNACRLAGRDPVLQGVPEAWRVTAAFAANAALRRIHAEKFPHMKLIEFRRYRPTWRTNGGWKKGNECWHEETEHYYRLEKAAMANIEPGKAGSGWIELRMDEVSAFVQYAQPWEATEMDPGGVDVEEFAYAADPKYNPEAAALKGCRWFGEGVLLPSPAPEGVFVKFTPKAPRVCFDEWKANGTYEAGSLAMHEDDCWKAVENGETDAGTGTPGADESGWTRIRVDEAWEEYLTQKMAAALMTEDQGKYQTDAAANTAFEAVCEIFHEGAGETRARTGRFRR